MKGAIQIAIVAAAAAGVAAQPHNGHQHLHRHAKKHQAVDKRDVATVTAVVPAMVTKYVLDGDVVDDSKAQAGIKDGLYLVVGSSKPTFTPPPPPPAPTSTSTSMGGQFIEIKTSSSTSTTSTSSTPTPTPSSSSSSSSSSAAAASSSSSSSGTVSGGGLNSDFPSGKIPCSHFPSDYGAVGVPWLGTGLWTSLQHTGSWTPGVLISNIVAGVSGGCSEGMFCSYACPAGYQKTQWPASSQGATGQSIGGLWCNSDGMLELTRPDHPKLCEQGAGGVTIQNNLSGNSAVCRTDYPASESMVIPIDTQPGQTYPLTNPASSSYYQWQGKKTTAQYYVNNQGVAVQDACVWNSATNPSSAGNWAPINLGVGQDETGITYVSIFLNKPTSTAELNFNIEVKGSVNGECWFKNGKFSGGDANGCTTAFQPGGNAVFVFSN